MRFDGNGDGPIDPDPGWDERRRAWGRKLGRLRLDAEPIEEQLARHRRVTVALSIVPTIIAAMFVALFTAFRRPDIGLIVAAILFLPIVSLAWLDDWLLRRRARSYLRDLREHEARIAGPSGGA